MINAILLALLGTANASTADAPRYLLADVGVRVDLPDGQGWDDVEWADWKLQSRSKSVVMNAWASPLQITPTEADLAGWVTPVSEQAELLAGGTAELTEQHLGNRHGQPSVELSLKVRSEGAADQVFHAVGFPVRGQVFFLSTLAPARRSAAARRTLDELVDAVEVIAPAQALHYGDRVEVDGVAWTLPEGWRLPLDEELHAVEEITSKYRIGLGEGCVTAVRPVAGRRPGVMVSCPETQQLGVVDEYSFESVDAELRDHYFRGVEMAAAEHLDGTDRPGFLYKVPFETITWYQAMVPSASGIVDTRVLGALEDDAFLASAARASVVGAALGAPHPASLGDQIAYYVGHRPTHPFLLIPVALLLLGIVGLVGLVGLMMARGRRNQWTLEDEAI